MDKRAVYSHVVESEVRSSCDVKYVSFLKIPPRDCDEAHHTFRRTCT